jgi:GNAT superfamily N-acetyltransferase
VNPIRSGTPPTPYAEPENLVQQSNESLPKKSAPLLNNPDLKSVRRSSSNSRPKSLSEIRLTAELTGKASSTKDSFLLTHLNHEDAISAIEDLRDNLDEMAVPPKGVDEEEWNYRLDKTNELLDMIESAMPGLNPDKDHIVGYQVGNEIKGILVLENKTPPSVYAFVTSPESKVRGAGRALLEQARKVSMHNMDGDGALQLTALNSLAKEIYEHWGFKTDPLDPEGKRMTIGY